MKKVSQTKTKNNSGHMGQLLLSHVTRFKLCFHYFYTYSYVRTV